MLAELDDPRVEAFGAALEAIARLSGSLDRTLLQNSGIGLGSFEALLRIQRSGGQMTMGELGRQIVLSSGGVTRLMDRLAEQGLAERKACSTDRRIQYAAITDKGLEKLRGALKHHLEDLSREFTDRMSADELETIVRVMDRLRSPG